VTETFGGGRYDIGFKVELDGYMVEAVEAAIEHIESTYAIAGREA